MGSVFKQSKINKLVFLGIIWEKKKDHMKDETEIDQRGSWPRIHKQKGTKKMGKMISRIILEIGKRIKYLEKPRHEIFNMKKYEKKYLK